MKQAVLSVLGNRFTTQARVDRVEVVSDHYRLIDLASEGFKDATFAPTAKVQLNAGNWQMRTYTPLPADGTTGHAQILAYLPGKGPGSTWAESVKPGDCVQVVGPQTSLDLVEVSGPVIFFGDETSFAAAKSLKAHLASNGLSSFFFEVSSVVEARAIADRLELGNIQCYERAGEAHLPLLIEAIERALDRVAGASCLVLTGNGRSIQALRSALRARNSYKINYRAKAYWVPGKTGLD